jgi:hypothetical protein
MLSKSARQLQVRRQRELPASNVAEFENQNR